MSVQPEYRRTCLSVVAARHLPQREPYEGAVSTARVTTMPQAVYSNDLLQVKHGERVRGRYEPPSRLKDFSNPEGRKGTMKVPYVQHRALFAIAASLRTPHESLDLVERAGSYHKQRTATHDERVARTTTARRIFSSRRRVTTE